MPKTYVFDSQKYPVFTVCPISDTCPKSDIKNGHFPSENRENTIYPGCKKKRAPTATISSKCVILKYFLYYNIFVYLHYISKHHIYYV